MTTNPGSLAPAHSTASHSANAVTVIPAPAAADEVAPPPDQTDTTTTTDDYAFIDTPSFGFLPALSAENKQLTAECVYNTTNILIEVENRLTEILNEKLTALDRNLERHVNFSYTIDDRYFPQMAIMSSSIERLDELMEKIESSVKQSEVMLRVSTVHTKIVACLNVCLVCVCAPICLSDITSRMANQHSPSDIR